MPPPVYTLFRTIGTFTKAQAASVVKLTWTSHGIVGGGPGASFCDFQLRVDGLGEGGLAGDSAAGRAIMYTMTGIPTAAPISVSAVFSGVAVGPSDVQIFLRGNATSCELNFGFFPQLVIVEEMN